MIEEVIEGVKSRARGIADAFEDGLDHGRWPDSLVKPIIARASLGAVVYKVTNQRQVKYINQ